LDGAVRISGTWFKIDLVDIAPSPIFARLERLDEWMANLAEVGGGVTTRRGVAASDVSARQTKAEMNPPAAGFQALLAAMGVRVYRADLIQVSALVD
jgi:hypothetical protein